MMSQPGKRISQIGFDPQWSWGMIAVLGLASILFFVRLGERSLWSEEVRWAEIPREMQLQSNFFKPTINGQSYYDKPLGSYWLVLLASWFTGGVNELAARLPSAVAGWLGVLILLLLARRLYDSRTAAWAGLILATSFSFLFFSRHASTDVETVTGVLTVLWLLIRFPTPSVSVSIAIWILMALTSLTKGLLGFVLPILIMTTANIVDDASSEVSNPALRKSRIRRWMEVNPWLFQWATIPGFFLALLVYFSPFLISQVQTGSAEGLEMVFRENIRRFYAPVNHRGPITLYTYVIFLLLAPWSILLPPALLQAHYQADAGGRKQSNDRFALAYFWSTFLFFTLASSRRSYYLLPVLPACALLIGRLLTAETLQNWVVKPMIRGVNLLMILLLLSGIGILAFLPTVLGSMQLLQYITWRGPLAVLLGFCLILATGSFKSFAMTRFRTAFGMTTIVVMGYGYLLLWPNLDAVRTQKSFAMNVLQVDQLDDRELILYRNRDIVYYLGKPHPIQECHDLLALRQAIQDRPVRWLIVRRRDLDDLPFPYQEIIQETCFGWEEKNRLEGKLVLLKLENNQ